jgi:predicted double-glycine peptidase
MFLLFAGVVSASSINGDYKGNPIVKLKSNGQVLAVEDTPAIVYEDRTMVPIYMLKKIGLNVTWDQNDYSVQVSLPNEKTDVRQYIIASDYFVYLQDATRYISTFGSIMDNYYRTQNEKGFSANDYSILEQEYNKTQAKLDESNNKYNDIRLKVSISDSYVAYNGIKSLEVIFAGLKDAYIDLTAWKMAKYEYNYGPDIYNQSYADYAKKNQDSHNKALTLMDGLKVSYNNSIADSLK